MFSIEIVGSAHPTAMPKALMIDLDGTVSVIREGWHEMLIEMDFGILRQTPGGADMPENELREKIKGFVELQIGKQTVAQFEALADAIRKLGGSPLEPKIYDRQYHERLDKLTSPRFEYLKNGGDPKRETVPGTHTLLEMFRHRGLKLYLVSGTEDSQVKLDARLLRIEHYFDGGIFGGLPQPGAFSKAKLVKRIIEENKIRGEELLGIGDGHTETQDVKQAGGFAIGVASDETRRDGRVDAWKRDQLIRAGADWIIPDYADVAQIERQIFG